MTNCKSLYPEFLVLLHFGASDLFISLYSSAIRLYSGIYYSLFSNIHSNVFIGRTLVVKCCPQNEEEPRVLKSATTATTLSCITTFLLFLFQTDKKTKLREHFPACAAHTPHESAFPLCPISSLRTTPSAHKQPWCAPSPSIPNKPDV